VTTTEGIDSFRQRVIEAHKDAFAIHTEVIEVFESAFLRPRTRDTSLRVALELLMYQAVKSDGAVSLLAQHGLMEDTATIARRLMELAVQATYIWADGDAELQVERSSRYVAFLWRNLPPQATARMPDHIKEHWKSIDEVVGEALKPAARQWGPKWNDMFAAVGMSELYVEDYSFLSSTAHGSHQDLIFHFSLAKTKVQRHDGAWVLLWYASKYFLIVAGMWNNVVEEIPDDVVAKTIERVATWKKPTASGAS
jgi:hypothetical protein